MESAFISYFYALFAIQFYLLLLFMDAMWRAAVNIPYAASSSVHNRIVCAMCIW